MAQRHDIEDVLSSIRRLVATDPTTVPQTPVRPAPTMGPALVLDQAQRVTDPEDPFQMIHDVTRDDSAHADVPQATKDVSEEIAGLIAETDPSDDPVPAIGQEDDDDADPVASDASRRSDFPEDPHALEFEFTAPAPKAEDGEEGLGPVDTDSVSTADLSDWDAENDPSLAFEDPEPGEIAPPRPDVPSGYAEDTDFIATAVSTSAIRVTQAALENPDLLQLSPQLAHDDALRDLIAETVRQELAGDLGERITRNVRKLVRRELRQMLASEEFD